MSPSSPPPAGGADAPNPHSTLRWATNAPPRWPALVTPVDVPASPQEILTLRTTAEYKRLIDASGTSLKVSFIAPTYVVDDGLLEATFELTEHGRQVPVFVYGDGGAESSGHFAAVQSAFATRDLEPIYFAPERLDASAAPLEGIAGPLGFNVFSRPENATPEGDYSMWWSSPGDDGSAPSSCLDEIDRCYRAMDGKEAYFAGALLHDLGRLDAPSPVELPEERAVFAATGPESLAILCSLSAEKGLRFHFLESTPIDVRDRYWRHLAAFCSSLREALDRQNIPDVPTETEEEPLAWWQAARSALEAVAAVPKVQKQSLGLIPMKASPE